MRIGEAAKAAGCSVRALRHYHEAGALQEPKRNSSGYRDYSLHDLAEIFRIRAFIEAWVALANIDSGTDALTHAHELLSRKIDDLKHQQRKLEALISGEHGVPYDIAETWTLIRENLSSPDIVNVIIEGLRLWQALSSPSASQNLTDRFIALSGKGYMSGTHDTLLTGDMLVDISDAVTSEAQAEALSRLL